MVSGTLRARARGASLGLVADRLVGEPPTSWHPLRGFGATMGSLERAWWNPTRRRGVAHAAIGTGLGASIGLVLERAVGTGPAAAVATTVSVGGRALGDAALSVRGALDRGDWELARLRLPALVGRDPAGLDDKEMARAVVESVAENTVDAVVAPALWALAAGAAGSLAYRAVNTLDAMVGHRSERYERFGWASARLDDAAGWVPARVTAALVAAVRPRRAGEIWSTVRRDAPRHPSPNAGVAEAAFAAALGLRLGGANTYGGVVDIRPTLGSGRPPVPADIDAAVDLATDVTAALATLLAVVAELAERR